MTGETAHKELRIARAKGECDWCFAKGVPGKYLLHNRGCKAFNDSGNKRPKEWSQ